MPFLVLFAFLSPYSAYFGAFSNFLYVVYWLVSLVALSLSIQPIFPQNPLSTNLN